VLPETFPAAAWQTFPRERESLTWDDLDHWPAGYGASLPIWGYQIMLISHHTGFLGVREDSTSPQNSIDLPQNG